MFDKVRKSVLADNAIKFAPAFLFGTIDLTRNGCVFVHFFDVSVRMLKMQGAKVVVNFPSDLGHEPGRDEPDFVSAFMKQARKGFSGR